MIVDLFAGPGGWDVGAKKLGFHPLGLELDKAAVKTRYAAGLATWQQDVTAVTDRQLDLLSSHVEGVIASPPCQDFSQAGRRAGIGGDQGELMWEVPRWIEAVNPRWVACEQVVPARGWFELFAHDLREQGWYTWTGVLNSADFGVPQTRKRVFLLAHRDRPVGPPVQTHSQNPRPVGMFDEKECSPWISMAGALRWEDKELEASSSWVYERPSTTIVGSFRPDVVAAPGWRGPGDGPRQNTEGSVTITPSEAAILQGFPTDFPWQGSKSKQFEQIGNAVPPPLAKAVLEVLI